MTVVAIESSLPTTSDKFSFSQDSARFLDFASLIDTVVPSETVVLQCRFQLEFFSHQSNALYVYIYMKAPL
jgi:hypothetical protein